MNAVVKKEPQTLPAGLTPMEILNNAVANGANIETLEKLMTLQERWEANQARKEFDAAVSEAKAELKPVVRAREGHNAKKYADFAAIATAVDPIITKFGLSYRFRSEQGERINVTCILSHKAGHYEQTTLSGPADNTGNKNAIQAIGSTLTYLQRYSLVQMLGLAAADDDDAAASNNSPINAEQLEQLQALIVETGSDISRFCKHFKIANVAELPIAKFGAATALLQSKRK